jgi:nucleotide-binding universal stress UspA family protein
MPRLSGSIVCSIDLSPFSAQVMAYGRRLAEGFAARLRIFHAVMTLRDGLHDEPMFERSGQWQTQRRLAVHRIRALMGDAPVPWDLHVGLGDPVEQLNAYCTAHSAGLVVAASHGISGLRRVLMGTVVERMARQIHVPLLTIRSAGKPGPASDPASLPLQRIMVCCRLRPDDQTLLKLAAAWSAAFDAELCLFHAVERPIDEMVADPTSAPYHHAQTVLKEKLEKQLVALARPLIGHRRPLKTHLVDGPASETAPHWAREIGADLVMAGVRGHGMFSKMLLGSTTEALLRQSPCHVLTLPAAVVNSA